MPLDPATQLTLLSHCLRFKIDDLYPPRRAHPVKLQSTQVPGDLVYTSSGTIPPTPVDKAPNVDSDCSPGHSTAAELRL